MTHTPDILKPHKMPISGKPLTGPHLVLIPSAGMGHLTPFSRLAASLSDLCHVTMVSILPTVSSAESSHLSDFFSSYPDVHSFKLELPPFDSSAYPNADPFFLCFEGINQSAPDLMTRLLTKSSKPVSALIIDITLSTSMVPLAKSFGIPCYILFTASAAMLSFCAYFPTYYDSNSGPIGDIQINGLRMVPVATIPQALHNPKHIFTPLFIQNGKNLSKADGILVNTCESLEKDTLVALRDAHVQPGFPPVVAVGPLLPVNIPAISGASEVSPWLDMQPEKSVVYVSFGSRTAMPKEQIRELGLGLEASGCQFLWVVKTTVVDSHDNTELEELLGEGFLERVKDRGLVVKGWVEQEELLQHKAVGGFVSHCGWNSVTEAALHGVRMLAWPQLGDQRINAGVVARSGLGVWEEKWSWEGEKGLVSADEIGKRVKEMMADRRQMATAQKIGEEAQMATRPGGASYEGLVELVRSFEGFEVSDA
ncbi:Glycosyltransferase [Rhynchospora pubera]|uniref:Glycosyltransferase n=1 Tax=Rhynchospora pubera TaxID=906938 RepID=A0AAV8CFQ0_9POAL|nr:Glycosyltransferase [Rhynchospora pubera]